MTKALLFLALIFCSSSAFAGESRADLMGPGTISGWIDLRLGSADGEKSWLAGGFGKLRTGDNSDSASLAQAAILWTPRLSDTVAAHVLVQDVPDAQNPFGVSEAYFKWKPVPTSPTRYSFRIGRMFPPISLEHDGPGWTTTRTLTPSAINSWVGEELLLDGLEANLQRNFGEHGIAGTFGLFQSADTAGTILAFRGWALHDIASSGNTELRLPTGNGTGYSAVFLKQAPYSQPSVEVDGRLGGYGRFDWSPPAPITFNLFYFDNPGKPTLVKNGQYGWTTRFIGGGLKSKFSPKDELLSQVMSGSTKMGGIVFANRHAVDIEFDSAYVLMAHAFDNGGKLTGRADYFEVIDHSWIDTDNNNEKGLSYTLSWTKPLNDHFGLTLEGLHVASRRAARSTQFRDPDQAQTQVQLALKIHL